MVNLIVRKVGVSALMCASLLVGASAMAESPDWQAYYAKTGAENGHSQGDAVLFDGAYALGVARYDLDDHTELLGWQVAQQVYIGRQDGLDSGLTVVWQLESNQVSLSKDGLRLTRRF